MERGNLEFLLKDNKLSLENLYSHRGKLLKGKFAIELLEKLKEALPTLDLHDSRGHVVASTIGLSETESTEISSSLMLGKLFANYLEKSNKIIASKADNQASHRFVIGSKKGETEMFIWREPYTVTRSSESYTCEISSTKSDHYVKFMMDKFLKNRSILVESGARYFEFVIGNSIKFSGNIYRIDGTPVKWKVPPEFPELDLTKFRGYVLSNNLNI